VPDLGGRIHRVALLTGAFRLRSGQASTSYFDKYRFESDPELLGEVCTALTRLLPEGIDAIAGLELGGVPLATVLSQQTGVPTVFVRKERKDYGTCRLAEGMDVAGRRLLVIEDLRREGATVDTALCVIDREAGAVARLAAIGVELRALFRMSELS
jgi:orotate phosphoribosyltransferase